jgi:hypothetical protein
LVCPTTARQFSAIGLSDRPRALPRQSRAWLTASASTTRLKEGVPRPGRGSGAQAKRAARSVAAGIGKLPRMAFATSFPANRREGAVGRA